MENEIKIGKEIWFCDYGCWKYGNIISFDNKTAVIWNDDRRIMMFVPIDKLRDNTHD